MRQANVTACTTPSLYKQLIAKQLSAEWCACKLIANSTYLKVKERIVLSEIHLRTTGRHLSMGSHT